MSDDPTARITAALAGYQEALARYKAAERYQDDDAIESTRYQGYNKALAVAEAVAVDWPVVLARLAAAEALIAVVRDILPDEDYYDYSRADLIKALAAYDRVVGAGEGT